MTYFYENYYIPILTYGTVTQVRTKQR